MGKEKTEFEEKICNTKQKKQKSYGKNGLRKTRH